VRGWELQDLDIFRRAAANGDLFIKEPAASTPVTAAAAETASADDGPSFL
jgi:hypothetical protein